jgi:Protein of unknown function (DUF2934)
MIRPTDRDGKSKTASAVDAEHYPEQNEVDGEHAFSGHQHQEIAQRAYELWLQRGSRDGYHRSDWFDAEEELRAAKNSNDARGGQSENGSVQK